MKATTKQQRKSCATSSPNQIGRSAHAFLTARLPCTYEFGAGITQSGYVHSTSIPRLSGSALDSAQPPFHDCCSRQRSTRVPDHVETSGVADALRIRRLFAMGLCRCTRVSDHGERYCLRIQVTITRQRIAPLNGNRLGIASGTASIKLGRCIV